MLVGCFRVLPVTDGNNNSDYELNRIFVSIIIEIEHEKMKNEWFRSKFKRNMSMLRLMYIIFENILINIYLSVYYRQILEDDGRLAYCWISC